MVEYTTITVSKETKDRLDATRAGSWDDHLSGLLDGTTDTPTDVRLDSAQVEELAELTAEKSAQKVEDRLH